MSEDQEKYLYFTIGLLKNSFGLEALREDALKHHMIDQPGQLIALRLTEYYELMARGMAYSGTNVRMAAPPPAISNGVYKQKTPAANNEGATATSAPADELIDYRRVEEVIVETSPDVEQNADDAAEYWSEL